MLAYHAFHEDDRAMTLALRTLGLAVLAGAAEAAVVQIDVSALVDSDFVVTNAAGPIDTTQDPLDGPFSNRCLVTQSAAAVIDPIDPDGMPDDGTFPATGLHPDVILEARNGDDGLNALQLTDDAAFFSFLVPPDRYAELHLFMLCGEGNADINVELVYDVGSILMPPVNVPDWFDDPADTPARYHLIDGLDRVQCDGVGPYHDANDAALFGLRFDPDPTLTLTSLIVTRIAASGDATVLDFFGATAVTADAISLALFRGSVLALTPGWRAAALPLTSPNDDETAPFPLATASPGVVSDTLPAAGPLILYRLLGPGDAPTGNGLRAVKTGSSVSLSF
jgi:hypothetical protein